MKNLHLLESKQPCRLHYYSHMHDLGLSKEPLQWKQGRNIYITINQEIQEGVDQWYLDKVLNEPYNSGGAQYASKQDIIVLTTDIDLIKDGVGEISNKFLNWFIKHPTCELVGVMSYAVNCSCANQSEYKEKPNIIKENTTCHLRNKCDVAYKINVATIPKSKVGTFIKCYDRYNQLLKEGDYVDVQKDGVHQIYKKEDGQLYFKPYGLEDKVSAYFSNDIAKCDADGNWINNDRYEDIEEDEPKQYPKTFKDLFANTGIEPRTGENGDIHYNFKASMKEEPKLTLELTKEEAKGLLACLMRTHASGTDLDVGEIIEDKLAKFLYK